MGRPKFTGKIIDNQSDLAGIAPLRPIHQRGVEFCAAYAVAMRAPGLLSPTISIRSLVMPGHLGKSAWARPRLARAAHASATHQRPIALGYSIGGNSKHLLTNPCIAPAVQTTR